MFDELSIPTIDEETAAELEAPLSAEELTIVIKSKQNEKLPGPDRFSSTFIEKVCWPAYPDFIVHF